jgi:hypothetical protein
MVNEKDSQASKVSNTSWTSEARQKVIPEDQKPSDAIPVSEAGERSYTSSNTSWTSEARQKVIPEDQKPSDAIPFSESR